jgi:hypothetical protein
MYRFLSVLRDTLGDETIENDRLRYVWMLTYTKPSTMQKIMAAIRSIIGGGEANRPRAKRCRPL